MNVLTRKIEKEDEHKKAKACYKTVCVAVLLIRYNLIEFLRKSNLRSYARAR